MSCAEFFLKNSKKELGRQNLIYISKRGAKYRLFSLFFLKIIFCSYYSMLLENSLANYKAGFTCRNKCIDKYRQLGTTVESGGLSSGK